MPMSYTKDELLELMDFQVFCTLKQNKFPKERQKAT